MAHTRLLALWTAGERDEDAFYIGEECLPLALSDLR
jgi:hypothetical protein